MIKKIIENFINKYIGKTKYIVRLINSEGTIEEYTLTIKKELDAFVIQTNEERYWQVQKISKRRELLFKYNKEVIHSPLFFSKKGITEKDTIETGLEYSFIKIDESLINVKRVENL